jgi:hypothetical protein
MQCLSDFFPKTIYNGVYSSDWQYVRETANNPVSGPVEDVTSPLMRCYEKSGRGAAAVQTVTAGSKFGFTSSASIGHPGPVFFYMARVPDGQDVNSWVPSSNVWFKISQDGSTPSTDPPFKVDMTELYTTIPASLAAGNYLLRVEHIGLHIAGSPQFYLACAQLKVTGNGASSPSSLVSFPGAYSKSDPGLTFVIYGNHNTYPYPGPAVWGGGSTGGGSGGSSTTSARPPATSTSTPPPTSTGGGGSGPCASLYGQCGGSGYTGPTCCSSGTCKKSSDFYSQCL